MKNLDLTQIHLRLENEVNHLAQSILYYQSDAAKEDAHVAVMTLEPEIDELIIQLNEKKLSFGEFDSLVLQKKDEIELCTLKQRGVSVIELEMIRYGIIHSICNAVFSSVIDVDDTQHHEYVVEEGLDKEIGIC